MAKPPVSKTRTISEITIFASLYAALTWILAPISYAVFQFRVAEALKSIVVRRRHLIAAFVIGNFLSNLLSPYAGVWELIWMPFINVLGAGSAWLIGHRFPCRKGMAIGGLIYAIWVAFGVSYMLSTLFNLPFPMTFIYLLIPETTLIVGFSPIMAKINDQITKRYG